MDDSSQIVSRRRRFHPSEGAQQMEMVDPRRFSPTACEGGSAEPQELLANKRERVSAPFLRLDSRPEPKARPRALSPKLHRRSPSPHRQSGANTGQ